MVAICIFTSFIAWVSPKGMHTLTTSHIDIPAPVTTSLELVGERQIKETCFTRKYRQRTNKMGGIWRGQKSDYDC